MQQTVRTRIVRIGNSRGIRIPKVWLGQLALDEEVEMTIEKDKLTVKRPRRVREGWDEAFERMAENQDDKLLDAPLPTTWDEEEWEW